LAKIQDTIRSSTTSVSFAILNSDSSKFKDDSESMTSGPLPAPVQPNIKENFVCGTLVYNSYEALKYSEYSQMSDAYSLGLSILALFQTQNPLATHTLLKGLFSSHDIIKKLIFMIEHKMVPHLSSSDLFNSLLAIEDGTFIPVHKCLNEVYCGLTEMDPEKRMSVREARKRIQTIKEFLPQIGIGWKYPTIDEIIGIYQEKQFPVHKELQLQSQSTTPLNSGTSSKISHFVSQETTPHPHCSEGWQDFPSASISKSIGCSFDLKF
ncbi:hypothetical protein ADUPG1_009745, partial [Aduncisulcus paluster]